MKRIKFLTSILLTASLLLTACDVGDNNAVNQRVQSTTTGVADVLASRMADDSGETQGAVDTYVPTPMPTADNVVAYGDCDLDLTTMSADLIYANVYSIVTDPSLYLGMTIRMKGTATSSHDDVTGQTYYACFIADAAGCCQAGLEYQLADGEYPEDGEEITILGTFEVYEENGNPYAILDNSVREF